MRPTFILRPPTSTTFPLRESLVRLNLCSERDFRRCRRRVRRLARGIPAFDFVWIDALLHAGVLTPFQAKVLESSPPEVLRVGPCVLLGPLGPRRVFRDLFGPDTWRLRQRRAEAPAAPGRG